jgi:hypothetical protein
MKTRTIALLGLLTATGWAGAVYAQPNYPPPPPPPNDYDNRQPYDNQGYDNQGYDNQGYDNQGYDNQGDPGYDNQEPYYDDQAPEGSYDQAPGQPPGYPPAPGNDPGYYDPGYGNQGQADISIFYGNLSPYGRWIQRASYGWVWEPTRVRVGWRPYTEGRWAQTDYGWTWLSDEPWGWATYHYGRWLLDREYGWLWVPGTEWGPAWVSFQEGNGYVGWAPLPPSVGFRVGFGIQIGGLSLSAQIDPYAYCFVPERSFLEERVGRVILPPARNVTFIRNTTNITRIIEVNHRIVNQSLPVQRIEQATGQRVHRYQISEVRDPRQARVQQVQGDRINLFRPAATLARVQPNVTPQVVIRNRAQQLRERPQQGGQPVPGQPGQWRRPQPQPGQAVQPGQPQPVPGRQPRWQQQQNGRPMPTPEDMQRKHQNEEQQLRSRQTEERNRIQQLQESDQREQQNQRNQARQQQVQAQHQAEAKALQEQQQREQQLLQARQQREQQAAEARRDRGQRGPQQGQPQARPNQGQNQDQQDRQNRRNQDQKDQKDQKDRGNQRDRRERRPEPPPPPPPGR